MDIFCPNFFQVDIFCLLFFATSSLSALSIRCILAYIQHACMFILLKGPTGFWIISFKNKEKKFLVYNH